MIRILEMELRNVKNVTNGRIVFEENSAGGSVTGIYGQNGSGKTAVIDALECVQRLMSGEQTGKNSADLIRYGASDMSIEILFEISARDGFFARNVYLQYDVTFIRGGTENRLRVSRESFRMSVVRDRMGREVLVHALDSDPDVKGRKNFTMTPAYLWRSIRSIEDIRSDVDYESNTTFDDSLSYMFSPNHLQRVLESARLARREPSQQSKAYLEGTLAPLSKAVELLGDFARNDMHVSTTSRTSTASYSYIVLPDVSSGSEGRIYDLIESNPVTEEEYESLNDTVARFNLVLSALIPGLRIALQETGQKIMPDGSTRLMATFMSLRGEARIPFRCESEGIVRLTSLLSLLVHAYNDRSACVVVDEIDSGVFEYLLGQLLHVMAEVERPAQRRGVPLLAPVIEELKQLKRYTDAELMAAVISGFFTVFIKSNTPSELMDQFSGVPDEMRYDPDPTALELGTGSICALGENEDIVIADPKRPNTAFEAYVSAICRYIGAALEIPYEILIKQFTASYSASRAAQLEAWKTFRARRERLIDSFCQPVYEEWLAEAVSSGRIAAPGFFSDPAVRAAWSGADWAGDSQGQLDPVKEVEAANLRIKYGFSTLTREAAETTGMRFETIVETRKREIAKLQEAGITLDGLPVPTDPVVEAGGSNSVDDEESDDDTDLEDDSDT